MSFTKDEIVEKVKSVPFWGHSIDLGQGITTPGRVMNNLSTVKKLQLPDDLSGKRVLDIGAWDGFYSFECEKKGAEVVAIDNLCRMQKEDEKEYSDLGNKGFLVAKEILNSNVEYRDMDVYDISREELGVFDIVLFLGVLYHLKYPLLALEKISTICKDTLILESAYWKSVSQKPLIRYAEGDSFNQDPTNWHIPNIPALESMLRDVGFKKVDVLYTTSMTLKSFVRGIVKKISPFYGRVIIKAFK